MSLFRTDPDVEQAHREMMLDDMPYENYALQPYETPMPAKVLAPDEIEFMSQMFARALRFKWIDGKLSRTAIVRRM